MPGFLKVAHDALEGALGHSGSRRCRRAIAWSTETGVAAFQKIVPATQDAVHRTVT